METTVVIDIVMKIHIISRLQNQKWSSGVFYMMKTLFRDL